MVRIHVMDVFLFITGCVYVSVCVWNQTNFLRQEKCIDCSNNNKKIQREYQLFFHHSTKISIRVTHKIIPKNFHATKNEEG